MRAFAPLTLLVLAACAPVTGAPALLADHVFVLDREPGIEVAVEADRLVYPLEGNDELFDHAPGDILVSSAGTGLLRKVVNIARRGDSIVVDTAAAQLTDAVVDGQLSHHLTGNGKDDGLSGFEGVYANFGDVGIEATNFKMSVVEGRIDFHPDFDVGLDITRARLSKLELVASGTLDADLVFDIETSGAVSFSKQKDLWTSVPKVFVQMVGLLPVVEVVTVRAGVGFTVEGQGTTKLRIGGRAHTEVSAGTRYSDGVWHDVGDHAFSFTPVVDVSPSDLGVNVDAYGYVVLDVKFYDLVGPFVGLYPFVGTHVDADGLVAFYGAEGVLGGHLVLGDNEYGLNYTLFDAACRFGQSLADCAANPPDHLSPIPRVRSGH